MQSLFHSASDYFICETCFAKDSASRHTFIVVVFVHGVHEWNLSDAVVLASSLGWFFLSSTCLVQGND